MADLWRSSPTGEGPTPAQGIPSRPQRMADRTGSRALGYAGPGELIGT